MNDKLPGNRPGTPTPFDPFDSFVDLVLRVFHGPKTEADQLTTESPREYGPQDGELKLDRHADGTNVTLGSGTPRYHFRAIFALSVVAYLTMAACAPCGQVLSYPMTAYFFGATNGTSLQQYMYPLVLCAAPLLSGLMWGTILYGAFLVAAALFHRVHQD